MTRILESTSASLKGITMLMRTRIGLIFSMFYFLTLGCKPFQVMSDTKDIFVNDTETRRPMTIDEFPWLIQMGGVLDGRKPESAVALAPDIILTALHVLDHHQTGRSVIGSTPFAVSEVLESYADMDVAIVRVKWLMDRVPEDMAFVPKIILSPSSITFGPDAQASKIYALGFPIDQSPVPYYAKGFTKAYGPYQDVGTVIRFNAGVTNGNSGGPLFLDGGFSLIGIVTGVD